MALSRLDGYPNYTGKILLKHYNELSKIKELIKDKNIYTLETDIENTEFWEDYYTFLVEFDNNAKKMLKEASLNAEYVYVFKDNQWFFAHLDSKNTYLRELSLNTLENDDERLSCLFWADEIYTNYSKQIHRLINDRDNRDRYADWGNIHQKLEIAKKALKDVLNELKRSDNEQNRMD
ncbi:hypothetical protein [uncultured Helicobacter sp.]|uniref:hypothetical protein n=1 Tax=uncultured Helicobacter sp. TaxID=175537 RepID=UPI00374E3E93